IEPEQLAVDKYVSDNGNEIRHGIEIDKYGAPVNYWIHTTGHPLESFHVEPPVAIPADRVLHFARQNRVRQTHGVTRLAPGLKKSRHLGMYEESTLVRARLEACIGAVITSQIDGDGNLVELGVRSPDAIGDDNTQDAAGNFEWSFEPGMNPQLPPGKD